MTSTTRYDFGDVVLVPFPFTDQSATKRRPAIVVSSTSYHQGHSDLILMAITSQAGTSTRVGDVMLTHWRQAGLLKPSVAKPVVGTFHPRLVLQRLGRLHESDRAALAAALRQIIGQ